LTRKFPKSIFLLLDLILICLMRFIPVKFVKFVTPKLFHNFLHSIYRELNLRKSDSELLIDAQGIEIQEEDTSYIYTKKIEWIFTNYFKYGLNALNIIDINTLITFLSGNNNQEKYEKNYERNWHIYRIICNLAHFNLGHKDYVTFCNQIIKSLNKYNLTTHTKDRYPIHYTSNMGHLGFLYLYLNHFQNFKPEIKRRRIILLQNKVANRYFLKLLMKYSKFQIKLIDENTNVDFQSVDTLQVSKDGKGIFRLNTPFFSFDSTGTNKFKSLKANSTRPVAI